LSFRAIDACAHRIAAQLPHRRFLGGDLLRPRLDARLPLWRRRRQLLAKRSSSPSLAFVIVSQMRIIP
jgi:hypothetical protein